MIKLAPRLAVVALVTLGMFVGTAHAQKIGVVDVNTVVAAMPEYQAAMKTLEDTKKIYSDSMKLMQSAYSAKLDAYSKVGETASADFKKKSQEDLAGLEQAFTKYRDSKFGQEGELAQQQVQLLKPIQEKLTKTLSAYAKKEKLAVIIPKASTIYVEDAIDLTTKFQEYLKAQASK
jgi:outer membrane protein